MASRDMADTMKRDRQPSSEKEKWRDAVIVRLPMDPEGERGQMIRWDDGRQSGFSVCRSAGSHFA